MKTYEESLGLAKVHADDLLCYCKIPFSTIKAIRLFADCGIKPGGFVESCLINDFAGAVQRADYQNSYYLKEIAIYIFNEIPSNVHGSKEAYDNWLKNSKNID